MFNFPWSNFHELNLDWILSVVKEAKEIFVKGEGDIQHAVETADQALETAEQAAAGVIADGAVTIPKLNSEVYSLFAYCVSGSVAPNFIPAGALVILRKSTIYNVTDGIYTATRNIPQAAIITAADLDQSATLYREGGMNYLLHNEEKLSGTIDLIKAGLVILVTGDEASAAIPADGLAYVTNNTHGLTDGFYFNSSGVAFPPTGGTADSDSFTAVNNILNALQTALTTLGSDDIANDSTVTGASVTDALDAVKNTLNDKAAKNDLTDISQTNPNCTVQNGIPAGTYFYLDGVLVRAKTLIGNGAPFTEGTNYEEVTAGGLNDLKNTLTPKILASVTVPNNDATWRSLLNSLFAQISNPATIPYTARLYCKGNSEGTYNLYYQAADRLYFQGITTSGNSCYYVSLVLMSAFGSCSRKRYANGTEQDESLSNAPSGTYTIESA